MISAAVFCYAYVENTKEYVRNIILKVVGTHIFLLYHSF